MAKNGGSAGSETGKAENSQATSGIQEETILPKESAQTETTSSEANRSRQEGGKIQTRKGYRGDRLDRRQSRATNGEDTRPQGFQANQQGRNEANDLPKTQAPIVHESW